MIYRKLGSSDLTVSAASVGTWSVGGAGWGNTKKEEALEAIRVSVEHGATTIDTAPIYGFGNPALPEFGYGYAEVVVGEAVAGLRDKVQLVSKCGLNYDRAKGPGSMYKKVTRQEIIEGCEGTLKRLGTDYLDLLFLHWPDNVTPVEESVSALQELIQSGKIRSYGLSNFTLEDTLKAHAVCPVGAVQLEYSMVNRKNEEILKTLHALGIGTMTYGSLGSGILTGSIRTLPDLPKSDMRVSFYDYFKEPKFTRIMALLKVMDAIANAHGVPVAQVAINWSASKAFVDTAILGASKARHAVANCCAYEWRLTEAEIRTLDAAIDEHLEAI